MTDTTMLIAPPFMPCSEFFAQNVRKWNKKQPARRKAEQAVKFKVS
jgi:hypothetical protein